MQAYEELKLVLHVVEDMNSSDCIDVTTASYSIIVISAALSCHDVFFEYSSASRMESLLTIVSGDDK